MSANPYEPPKAPLGPGATADFPDVTSVTFTLTVDEVNRARSALTEQSPTAFVVIIVMMWLAGFIGILGMLPNWARSLGCPPAVARWTGFALMGLLGFGSWIVQRSRTEHSPEPAPERTVELHREGVVIREEGSFEQSRPWAAIEEIKDNGREILFLITGYDYAEQRRTRMDVLSIPRRAFTAVGAAEAFLRVARGFWAREHPSK